MLTRIFIWLIPAMIIIAAFQTGHYLAVGIGPGEVEGVSITQHRRHGPMAKAG